MCIIGKEEEGCKSATCMFTDQNNVRWTIHSAHVSRQPSVDMDNGPLSHRCSGGWRQVARHAYTGSRLTTDSNKENNNRERDREQSNGERTELALNTYHDAQENCQCM